MRNQHLDSKTLSIPSSVLQLTITIFLGLFILLLLPTVAYADVFIPDSEYAGYYDYEGVYTVVGNVKNQNDFALIPTITISVIDNDQTKITHTLHHVPIPAMTDIPFKLKFPEIRGDNPVLLNAELEYSKTKKILSLYRLSMIKL